MYKYTSKKNKGIKWHRTHKRQNWALTSETLGWVIAADLTQGPKTEWQIQKDANAERHKHRKPRAAGETSGGSAGSSTHTGPGAEEAAEATTPSSTLASSKISTQSRFLIQDIRICHARRLHPPPFHSAPNKTLTYCKSLPFFYFLAFKKADCSIFTLSVGRLVGWRHH